MRLRLGLVFVALVSTVAFAADNDTGWRIELASYASQMGNHDVALGVPVGASGGPGGRLVALDFDMENSVGAQVGFRGAWGDVTLSSWSYDESVTKTVVDSVNGFLPTFTNAGFGDDFATRLDGTSDLESMLIDLAWSRHFAHTERGTWSWVLGLRSWSLERDNLMISDLIPGPGTFDDQVLSSSDADGTGLVAGLASSHELHEGLHFNTWLKAAFLTGTVESSNAENAFGDLLLTDLGKADRNFHQVELEARLTYNFAAGFDGFVGYQFKQFNDAVTELQHPDDIVLGLLQETTSNVSFSGVAAGLAYRF